MDRRTIAWQRLADLLPKDAIEAMARNATLDEVPALSEKILKGKIQGRTVITL